ncbi:MAG: heme ABC exporter ATP-binding protein CcmA [Chloroflexi bacterium HGW-Chloroflexi-10]|nr:MAG: heme ABC exporter ATP-binding protein CcmA [Chloroflexi bacterium HGW-Chloroflexi-10]
MPLNQVIYQRKLTWQEGQSWYPNLKRIRGQCKNVADVIEVNRLVKRFGHKQVLKNLDFRVAEGEFVALLGPNGAGKTTLLRILSSLSKPNFGIVRICGYDLSGQAAIVRQKLGVVSHLPLLYGDLNAEENLMFYARLYGILAPQGRINEVLNLVGLEKRRKDLVRTFSRGMQQRLAIGRAILHDPEVLLLDEPHTGLDQDASNMLDDVLQQVAVRGRTVVMTSHDLARTAYLASRFDVLSKGKICATVKANDLPEHGLLSFYQNTLLENSQETRGKVA